MNLRILTLSCALLATLALVVPAASAQPQAQGILKFTISFEHEDMSLPLDGRADMPVHVKASAENFVCLQPWKFVVDVKAHPFAKWAGASIEPPKVSFEVPQGQPGLNTKRDFTAETTLNLAWNVEDAPKRNAKQEYILVAAAMRDDPGTTRNCVPSFNPTYEASPPMTAALPDRTDQNQSLSEVGCDIDPFQPKCHATAQEVREDTAGLDTAIFLGVLALMMIGLRRRTA